MVGIHGERGRTRTCDPCLKRALLYQLSYAPAPLHDISKPTLLTMRYLTAVWSSSKPRLFLAYSCFM